MKHLDIKDKYSRCTGDGGVAGSDGEDRQMWWVRALKQHLVSLVSAQGEPALSFSRFPPPLRWKFLRFPNVSHSVSCPAHHSWLLTTHIHCVGIKPRGISCRFILMSFSFFSVYNFCCCASDIICLLRHWWTSVCFSTRTLIHTQQISTDGRKKEHQFTRTCSNTLLKSIFSPLTVPDPADMWHIPHWHFCHHHTLMEVWRSVSVVLSSDSCRKIEMNSIIFTFLLVVGLHCVCLLPVWMLKQINNHLESFTPFIYLFDICYVYLLYLQNTFWLLYFILSFVSVIDLMWIMNFWSSDAHLF